MISETGQLPDGIEPNKVYFAVVDTTLNNAQMKLVATLTDALTFDASTNPTNLTFNAEGGELSIVSRVSDKNSGDIGHPIQFNDVSKRWYINVSTASTDNQIGIAVSDYAVAGLGSATLDPSSIDSRMTEHSAIDYIVMRYVIQKANTVTARLHKKDSFSRTGNTTTGITTAEIEKYFGLVQLVATFKKSKFHL